MRRYTWDEIYDMAIDKAFGSPELNAKDHARWMLRNRIMAEDDHDIEEDEIPEESIEQWIADYEKRTGRHVMFDEYGNLQMIKMPTIAMQDIFIYVPAADQLIRIAEGTGDNLIAEDEELGYVDYVYYEQYGMEQDFPEVDGGQMMTKEMLWEKYDDLTDAIPDVLDMAYSNAETEYVLLTRK